MSKILEATKIQARAVIPIVKALEKELGKVRAHEIAGKAIAEEYAFPLRPEFDALESLVIDLAYFLVWSGIFAPQHDVHPKHIHTLKHRLFHYLRGAFSPRQIEELTWRITQCVAFNWHNDFLELDMEVGVTPLLETAGGG